MKKKKHQWKRRPADDEVLAECRECCRCGRRQYVYGTTAGVVLFWLPEIPDKCTGKKAA